MTGDARPAESGLGATKASTKNYKVVEAMSYTNKVLEKTRFPFKAALIFLWVLLGGISAGVSAQDAVITIDDGDLSRDGKYKVSIDFVYPEYCYGLHNSCSIDFDLYETPEGHSGALPRIAYGSDTPAFGSDVDFTISRENGDGVYRYLVSGLFTDYYSGGGSEDTDEEYFDSFSVEIRVFTGVTPGKPTIHSYPTALDAEDGNYSIGWQAPSGDYDYYLLQEKKNQGDWCSSTKGSIHGYCYAQKSLSNSFTANNRSNSSYSYRVLACNDLECGSPSNVVTVNVQPIAAPEVDWLTPTAGASLRAGDTQTLRVQVSDDREIASVRFYRNSVNAANLLDYPVDRDNQCEGCYFSNWPSVVANTAQLIAVAKNDAGKQTQLAVPVSVTSNADPLVIFDPDALPTEVVAGQQITLVARAKDSDGQVTTVEFKVGGAKVGAGTYIRTESGWDIYELPWTVPSAGQFILGARASDNESGDAESSTTVTFAAMQPPSSPAQLKIDDQLAPIPTNITGYYNISWAEVAGATHGYLLQQLHVSNDDNFKELPLVEGALSSYLPNQTQGDYRYRVAACNAAGCGNFSAEIALEVVLSAPQAPSGLKISKKHAEYDVTGTYSLQWKLVTSNPKPDYYQLQEKAGGISASGEWQIVNLGSSTKAISIEENEIGLYSYQLKACNALGCSPASELVNIEVLPPSLYAAEAECTPQCLRISGSGIDPDSIFKLTDRESGVQEVLIPSSIIWVSPTDEDPTTYAQLALSDYMHAVLLDQGKKGLRVSVENTNGELAGINAYGDKTVERLSQIDSAPSIGTDGTIYVGSGNNVYALNPEDGSVVPGWPFATDDLVKATPVVDSVNGNIYVGSLDDNLYALSSLGLELWHLPTGGDLIASAVLDENRILYQGSMDGAIYAVQAQNGALQWKYPAGAGIAETPVLAHSGSESGGTLYFTTVASSQVYALGRGVLGADQLVWESSDGSLLADTMDDLNWQPSESQLSEYQVAGRLYKLLLQPPLNMSRDVLTFWTYALVSGASEHEVASAYLESDTGRANFPPTQSNAAFVDALYTRAFPGQQQPAITYAGQSYTRGSLLDAMAGSASRAQIAVLFAQSMEFAATNNESLRRSFEYFYLQDYSWAAFSCDEGDEYTRDCDNDGLPDYWEILFFGDIESQSGDSDADGDGLSNHDALLAQIDPCANLCSNGVTAQAPAPAPMPTIDASQKTISAQTGSLPGNFRVNESGAATYGIPLSLPAGTAGVAPEISLNYTSQGGNGLVGHGWALGGLSAISRCRQTLGQDGQAKAITWTQEDRFCLDGQRLLVAEGDYGQPNSLYRTEIDSFALVQAHGGTSGHPDYFTVERKDGSISYYGESDSAKNDTGSGVVTWAISRFEDSAANPIEFDYARNGGHRISEIRYAYTGTGSEAGATLVFEYASRLDPLVGYMAGELHETSHLLDKVRVLNGKSEVLRYELEYREYPLDTLSRLERVRQCSGAVCQSDTVFNWRLPAPGQFATQLGGAVTLSSQQGRAAVGARPADINGDGRMDLIWLEPDWDVNSDGDSEIDYEIFKYVLADGNGFGSERKVYREHDNGYLPSVWEMIDYNADGRADLAVFLEDKDHWGIVLSEPDASGIWSLSGGPKSLPELTSKRAKFIDVNGDGLVDYLEPKSVGTQVTYRLLQPKGVAEDNQEFYKFGELNTVNLDVDWDSTGWEELDIADSLNSSLHTSRTPADFNGDGSLDFFIGISLEYNCELIYDEDLDEEVNDCLSRSGRMIATSTGDGAYESYYFLGDIRYPESVDLNGDGLPDVVYKIGSESFYILNNGEGFNEPIPLGINAFGMGPNKFQYIDYDNDGDTDLLWHDSDAKRLKVKRWSSVSRMYGEPESFRTTSGEKSALHLFVDINGDGVSDYVRVEDDQAFYYPTANVSVPVNVIDKITNGLGTETEISYGSLVNSGHYTRRDIQETTEYRCTTVEEVNGSTVEEVDWCGDLTVPDLAGFYGYLNDSGAGDQRLGKLSPTLELMGPMYTVTRVESSAPTATDINAKSAVSYYYAQAKVQAGGRGMLGFEKLTTVDEQTGVRTTTNYRQDFPFIGYPQSTQVRTADGYLLSEAVNTWKLKNANGEEWDSSWFQSALDGGSVALGPLQPWLAQSVETSYALAENGAAAGEQLNTSTTENLYDQHGNPAWIKVTTEQAGGDRFETETWNDYGSEGDTVDFPGRNESLSDFPQLGRLTETKVTHRRRVNGESAEDTRTSAFTYYRSHGAGGAAGLLESEIVEPDEPALRITSTYTYDEFGNKASATQSAEGEEPRSSSWQYENGRGRYLESESNSYGQVVSKITSRNDLGLPLQVMDTAGVSAHFEYDVFGRKLMDYSETGAHTITLLSDAGSHCSAGSIYQQVVKQGGGAESLTCFDKLFRKTRSAARGFDGSWVYADTEYDALGRVTRNSEPYTGSPGTASYWTEIDYDILGRTVGTDLPGITSNNGYFGSNGIPHDLHIEYQGYTVVTTNPDGHTKSETKNALGELTQVIDNLGGQLDYRYDAQGNLLSVRRIGDQGLLSTETQMCYDKLGRKRYMNDEDKGEWYYGYNGFGELAWQVDAKLQSVVNSYDRLGRLVRRVDYHSDSSIDSATLWDCETGEGLSNTEGLQIAGAVEGDTSWVYNNGTAWQEGVPPSALAGVLEAVSSYAQLPGYDSFGRTDSSLTSFVEGDDHWAKTTYDQYGRVFQQFDAAGDGLTNSATENHYNPYGYLEAVADGEHVNQASLENYYTVLAMDERGNVTESRQGNGVVTTSYFNPANGRLENQTASILGAIDIQDLNYQWDNLGNLENRRNGSGLFEAFDYDGLNRLKSAQVSGRTAQTVEYDGLGNIKRKSDVGDYRYGAQCDGGFGPHALCATEDGEGNITAYDYDANGNMLSDNSGRSLRYSTFDKPVHIEKSGHITEFQYGPNRSRYLRIDTDSTGTKETRYLGNVEKITHTDNSVEVKRYLPGGAVVTIHRGERQSRYLHKDHLGSVDAITDINGSVVQQMSFDAWGQRRNAQSWEALIQNAVQGFESSITTRGYTGHEMLDQVGLIHMNGRIYDPRLGRFLQADSFVDGVTNTQGYNRYSYVGNNPLSYTDPSGHFKLRQWVGAIVAVVGAVICGAPCAQFGWQAVALGATAGAAGAAANGGNILQGAVLGGISGAAFSGVAGADFSGFGAFAGAAKFAAFGTVGGITSVLAGGKFGHGFIAAGVGGSVAGKFGGVGGAGAGGVAIRTLIRSVIGGTISKVTGGKFANGAAFAAFASIVSEGANALPKASPGSSTSGSASQTTTPEGGWRPLTKGEKALAVDNGLAIDNVDKTRVYRKGYLGLDKEIIAPNGNIYIGTENAVGLAWSEDYSMAGLSDQSVFVHEMTHVYQSRTLGCGRICMGAKRIANPNYDYQYSQGKAFSSYGLEEQAAMVQDRFRLNNGLGHWRTNTSTLDQLNKAIPF